MFKTLAVVLCFCVFLVSLTPSGTWALIQIFRSLFGYQHFSLLLSQIELSLWLTWEQNSSSSLFQSTNSSSLLPLLTFTSLNDIYKINLNQPFLLKNLTQHSMLTLQTLLNEPISNLEIDYFHDATIINTVPNSRNTVGNIITKILQGGKEKIGTQMIIKNYPEIIQELVDANLWLKEIFSDDRVMKWRNIDPMMTYPIFVSHGCETVPPREKEEKEKEDDDDEIITPSSSSHLKITTTRTDLHCEPISNVVIQTVGKKKWTLVLPEYSHLIRPTISPDGRAYFYSSLDPFDQHGLDHVPHYEFIAEEGDLLYVPTWTWHRVDYLPNITAVSLSIFQFIPKDYLFRNSVYAFTLLPNLIKEAIGMKEQ
jgi:hypothetical protein